MTHFRRHSLILIALLALVVSACGGGSDAPEVTDARVGQPTGPNAALYFTAQGYGTDDALISASTDVAASVELHETVMGDDQTTSMRPVTSYPLPADGELVLEPGGLHIMFIDVDRLEVGSTVEVTLDWENAGEMRITAEVVSPADTGEHSEHG